MTHTEDHSLISVAGIPWQKIALSAVIYSCRQGGMEQLYFDEPGVVIYYQDM